MSDTRKKTARPRPFTRAGRTLDRNFEKAAQRVEAELKDVVAYLNDKVVPRVRSESTQAMRVAARKLGQLADYMDAQKRG